MTKHISVGYDGTKSAAEAVLWASDEAAARAATLRILCCYDVPIASDGMVGFGFAEAMAVLDSTAQTSAREMAAIVAARHPELHIIPSVSPGPAAPLLTEGLEPDDLVVVGASSHVGAAAFWLGSTPRRVVRHSPCPVAIVRGVATLGRPNRVVVGVDGSPSSDDALEWAGDEADRFDAELVVVHGWTYPYIPVDVSSTQARDLTEIDAACVLERAVERARERIAAPITSRLVEESPTSAILETLRDGDLLVLGSRGRGKVTAAVLGSTVNSVLEQCVVPCVVVHPVHPT